MIFTLLALLTAQPAQVAPPTPAVTAAPAPARAPGARRAPRAPDPERAAVMAPINAILRALETNDGAAILANTRPEGRATVALERENGQRAVRGRTWAEFAQLLRPGGERFTERLYAPRVMVDGDIAMVWARYAVRRGRTIDHCGFDHFDLVRDSGQWKVLNVTWSQRTTGCVAARSAPRAAQR